MSFTTDTKEELSKHYTKAAHCKNAEIAGGMLIKADENLDFDGFADSLERTCCKRAALRGMFMEGGAISNPEKNYHFEIASDNREVCEFAVRLMAEFGIKAKTGTRRGRYIAYVKEAENISELLNIIGAHNAMMRFENIRIERGIRGDINRQVNCETANLSKAVNAGIKQADAIRLIDEKQGLDSLDDNLRTVAVARLNYPDVSLAELGEMLTPKVGKSGINHRMRKIMQIAADIDAVTS